MNEPENPIEPAQPLDLGRLLGQRRAYTAIGGRCSAAHALLLRRIRDEKLYRAIAPTWQSFCGTQVALSRRSADRQIAYLNRFGPIYFELAQLIGISAREYQTIEPAVRDRSIVVDGAEVSVIPENSAKLREAVGRLLNPTRTPQSAKPRPTFKTRLAALTSQGRNIANQLIALHHSSASAGDRELAVEAAAELRILLLEIE